MIKYFCDRCGNEMDEDGKTIVIIQCDNSDEKLFCSPDEQTILRGMYCSKCIKKITKSFEQKEEHND